MTTTQMAYFIAMAEKLNFTTVAECFFVTQPTLSRQDLLDVLRTNKLLLGSFDAFGENANTPVDVFQEAFGPMDFEPEIQLCSSPLAIPSQVASGLGVSLCNKSNLFAIDPKTSIIEIDTEAKQGTSYSKGLIFLRERQSPLVERFLKIVQEKLHS